MLRRDENQLHEETYHYIERDAQVSQATVSFTLNASETNTTLESRVCSGISSTTTLLQIRPPIGGSSSLYILPSCVSTAPSLVQLIVQNMIIEDITSLPAGLTRISIQYSRIGSGTNLNTISWPSLFNRYTALGDLDLAFCKLTGSLPSAVPSILLSFSLFTNEFSGTIPSTLLPDSASSQPLVYTLSSNLLTGVIPDNLFQKASACLFSSITLNFDNNLLSGSLPTNLVGSCTKTKAVYVTARSNRISGSLGEQFGPQFFPNCSTFCNIDLSGNQLSGSLPSALFNPSTSVGTTKRLFLYNNRIQGLNPNSFSPCERATIALYLFNNSLTGTLPAGMFSLCLPVSIYIDVSQNGLTGQFPPGFYKVSNPGTFPSLEPAITLLITDNSLTGPIPSGLLSGANIVTVGLKADRNRLSGDLPSGMFLESNNGYKMTMDLSFSSNSISGSIPEGFFQTTQIFSSFTAAFESNQLTGNLPNDLCGTIDAAIMRIYFANNSLGGEQIPDSTFRYCKSSTFTGHFNNNKLNGTLPNAYFLSSNLQTSTWFFSSNSFDGWESLLAAPSTFSLASMDLSYNNLSLIPDDLTFSRMKKLTFLSLAYNPLIGANGRDVPGMSVFGLGGSYNYTNCTFNGFLPEVNVSKCPGSIRLGSNFFSGSIPASWGTCAVTGTSDMSTTTYLGLINVTNLPSVTGDISLLMSGAQPPSLVARNASLTGTMPDLGPSYLLGFQQDYYRLEIENSYVDFCSSPNATSRQPWIPRSAYGSNCELINTNACDCRELWPTCQISCSCPASSRPSAEFFCINGVWTAPSSLSPPTLVIPPGSTTTVISGNLSTSSVVFQSSGSTLIIKGCANISEVILRMTPADLEKLTHGGKKTQQQLILSENACSDFSTTSLVFQGPNKSGCRKVKSERSSEAFALSAIFTIDSSSCNIWWIVVVSVVGVLLIGGLVVTAVVVSKWRSGAYSKKASTTD